MPLEHDVLLPQRQLVAGGDAELLADQVHPGDHLGDRVLDLDAGVHLDEVEAAVLVQELEGAGAAVADADAGLGADLADLRALLGRDARRGRFLHDLLVAALHRAVAFAQVDGVALAVGEHLDLHVARVLQELLHVDHVVAEGGLGFLLGGGDGVGQRGLGVDHAHAAAAAAAGRLDDHRVADLAADAQVLVDVVAERTTAAGHAGHAGVLHRADRLDLVAHQADGVGLRPDEDEAGLLHPLGEIGVLAEEAVAGVDRLGVGDLGGGDDRGHVEVALRRGRRADAHRFVGHRHVLEVAVHGRVHRDRADPERVAGAQDAQRDLAAVGDHDLVEHGPSGGSLVSHGGAQPMTNSGWSNSTGWPLSIRIFSTVPETSASIGLNIFIASMMPRVSPALTAWPTVTNGGLSGAGAA